MQPKTIFVSAPFGPLNLPSIGLTILKGVAQSKGFPVEIHYLGMKFAQDVGVKFYNSLSNGYPATTALAGEFIFSSYFYDKNSTQIEEFIRDHLSFEDRINSHSHLAWGVEDFFFHQEFLVAYRKALALVQDWVKTTSQNLVDQEADIYGFSTMFQQNMGSLAIARMLKQLRPESLIIFGGPNCENPMGKVMLEEFSFIDMVCSGEGEEAFISVLEFVESNTSAQLHPNIHRRTPKNIVAPKSPVPKTDLEQLSPPNYDDYFYQLSLMRNTKDIRARVLLETSRGCWWGEKAHCTFCGLNGSSLAFRSKSAEKALLDIRFLKEKYPGVPISVVDNIIDYQYFKTLLPLLAEENIDVELFYETKANLTKAQLRTMRAAGISRIQPGIESFSSNVLKLMQKGVKAIRNICLLKWCLEEGVQPEWNFLWGFPDEDPSDYEKMSLLMPYLRHLTPPNASAKIRLDRFSPLYENRSKESIANVRPYSAYYKVYSIPESRLNDIAYYFDFEYTRQPDVSSYTMELEAEIAKWTIDYPTSYLIYSLNSTGALIFDGRVKGNTKISKHGPLSKYILQVCEKPTSVASLIDGVYGTEDIERMHNLLETFLDQGILISLDGVLFNVAVELTAAQSYPTPGFSAFINDLVNLDINSSADMVTIKLHPHLNSSTASPISEALS